jgi:hypothetical protein
MKRLGLLLGMVCLALFLVVACGQQKEPEKAQKSPAPTAAPAKEAAPTPKQGTTPAAPQPAPAKPSPEKK